MAQTQDEPGIIQSGTQMAQQAAADVAKKAAQEWAKRALIPLLPYLAIGAGIAILGIAIYSLFAQNGISGTTAPRLSNPNSVTDRRIVLEVDANAGNKSAAVQLAGEAAAQILSDQAQKLVDATNRSGDEKKISAAQTAFDTINTVGNGNIAADIRSVRALIATADPENPLATDGPLSLLEKDSSTPAVATAATALKSALQYLYETLVSVENPKLIINERDKLAIRNNEIDVRILKTLNYLVRPIAYGGAGHQKIKVLRIKHTYEGEDDQYSYEWGEDAGQTEKISPHARGQAMDISVIDSVKRGLFRKSIAKGKKRKPQSSKDILVAMQSNDPGKSRRVPGAESDGGTFMDMFENAAMDKLLTQIEENTGYDLSAAKKTSGNIGIVAQNVGLVIASQELDLPIDISQDNSSLEKIAQNIGRNYGAKCLALPNDSIRGNTSAEVRQSIGQSIIEQRLGLLPRSLTGNTRAEILSSIGKRKIESTFKLRPMSLQYIKNGDSFNTFIGQVVLEQTLGLPGGSFYSNDLVAIKSNLKNEVFDSTFGSTDSSLETGDKSDKIDQLLGLDKLTRYTYLMKKGDLSILAYKNAIGNAYLNAYINNFKNYQTVTLRTNTGETTRGVPGPITTVYVPSGTDNQSDEAINVPDGSIARLLTADYNAFLDIGKDEFVKKLTTDEDERAVITTWLNTYAPNSVALENVGFLRAVSINSALSREPLSTRLPELIIKLRSEIQNKNIEKINELNQQLEAQRLLLILEETATQTRSRNEQQVAENKRKIQENIALIQRDLAAESADIDQWSFITSEELEKNFALPLGTFTALFANNTEIQQIFSDVGKIRAATKVARKTTTTQSPAQDELIEEYSTLLFEREQTQAYLNILESATSPDSASITQTKNSLLEIEERIRTIENEQGENVDPLEPLSSGETFRDSLGICTDDFFADILIGGDTQDLARDRFAQIGMKKLEKTLNLPPSVLKLAFDKIQQRQEQKPTVNNAEIGRSYLESALDPNHYFAPGWMKADTISDVIGNITKSVAVNKPARNIFDFSASESAQEYFLSLFGIPKGKSLEQVRLELRNPSSQSSVAAASNDTKIAQHIRSIINNPQESIRIDAGTTARFLLGTITPDQFSQTIGTNYNNHPSIKGYTAKSEGNIDPRDALKTRLSPVDIGQRAIESIIDPRGALGAGWFTGKSLQDSVLIISQRLKSQPRHIFDVLPISESERLLVRGFGLSENMSLIRLSGVSSSSTGQDYLAYQAMEKFDELLNKNLKTSINKIGVSPGTTSKLFRGELTPEEYATEIGEAYLHNRSAQFISDSIKTTEGDALITKNDVVNILNGSYIDTAISIGSRAIDDGLVVPAGTVKALIDNPSLSCQVAVGEDATGLNRTQNCIQNILSENGKQKLAQFVGIVGNVNQSSNTSEYIGQVQAEQTLYNPIATPEQTQRQRETARFVQGIVASDSLIQGSLPAGWLKGQDLYEVRRNAAKLLYPSLVGVIDREKENTDRILGKPILARAEAVVLAVLGFVPTSSQEDTYYSIRALEVANWTDPNNGLEAKARATDEALHIEQGSTQSLLTRSISLAEYKKRIASYHTSYTLGNNTCNALKGDTKTKGSKNEKIFSILEKHNLDCATLAEGIRNPEQLKNTALINMLSPRDLGIILGFSAYFDVKVPIKGGFTDNFAQRQIEETLGLPDGSFTPNATIENIMEMVGPVQFAKSFRINTPSRSTNNEVAQYLRTHVFVPQANFRPSSFTDSYYFTNAVNLKNTTNIDSILKLNTTPGQKGSPTMSLLTGEISTGDYIQLVKDNQLKAVDPIAFAQFIVNGKTDGTTIEKAKYLAGFIQQYTSAGSTPTSAQTYDAYVALSELTHYDIDDKLDLVPGTVGNIILHPEHAKSIIISQGIREVSEQLLGPKNDLIDPDKINFYNDLGFLMQYSIPQFNAQYAAELISRNPTQTGFLQQANPQGDANGCQPPIAPAYVPHPGDKPDFSAAFGPNGNAQLQKDYIQSTKLYATQLAAHNEYVRTQAEYESTAYAKNKRSACQDFVTKSFIGQTIKELTTVKDGDQQVLPGITLKPYQTEALLKGDPKIFTAVGLAFSVNQLNAKRDENDTLTALLPPEFRVSYDEIYNATIGDSAEKNKAAFLASVEFEKTRAQIPNELESPQEYASFRSQILEDRPGVVFGAAAEFRRDNPSIPDRLENPEGYDIYHRQLMAYVTQRAAQARPIPGSPGYTQYVNERDQYIAQKTAQVKIEARKNIQYRYLDAQLSVLAGKQNLPSIPAGFTRAVFSGTAKERNNALLSYGLSYLVQSPEFRDSPLGSNPVIAGTLTSLLASNDPNRFELANIEDQARGQLGSLIDSRLASILERNNIPASLLPQDFSTEMARVFRGESPRFNQDAVRGALLSFADQRFGLPSGTTKAAYDLGQKISSGAQVKNADIAQVALIVFSKQLTKLDAQIGLPPGSLSAIISAVITPTPISIAVAVLTIVFGYSKVEMQMLCPPTDTSITQSLSPEEIAAIPYDAHQYWCKESPDSYRIWAQHNTRTLIESMIRSGEKTRDTSLAPLLIGTFREEDVDYFNGISEDGSYSAQNDLMTIVHGINPVTRGIKGIYQSDYMREYIHVSY